MYCNFEYYSRDVLISQTADTGESLTLTMDGCKTVEKHEQRFISNASLWITYHKDHCYEYRFTSICNSKIIVSCHVRSSHSGHVIYVGVLYDDASRVLYTVSHIVSHTESYFNSL